MTPKLLIAGIVAALVAWSIIPQVLTAMLAPLIEALAQVQP